MARESKFAYGFLFAGLGLPWFIDKLFGPLVAAAAASLCLVCGVALLISAHLHHDKAPNRSAMQQIGYFIMIGAILGLITGAVLGVGWALIRKFRPDIAAQSAGPRQLADMRLCERTANLTRRMREMGQRHETENRRLSETHQQESWAVPDPRTEPRELAIERFNRHSSESRRLSDTHGADLRNSGLVPEAQFVLDELLKRLPGERAPDAANMDDGALFFKNHLVGGGRETMDAADFLDRLAKKLCS